MLNLTLAEKRQAGGGGLSAFNGAFGVDSQDIMSAPNIDFGTFQVFPDQVNYGPSGSAAEVQPPSSDFNSTLNVCSDWIRTQTASARTWVFPFLTSDASSDLKSAYSVSKPMVVSACGIVTKDNAQYFVPVSSTAPVLKSPPGRKRKL